MLVYRINNNFLKSDKIIILTRTYFKDSKILIQNLCKTLNIFVNRDKYKFGIILDDERLEDHILGDNLIKNMLTDFIYYEPLPSNYKELFQALAFPEMKSNWGYDRQQWSTFYMDIYVQDNIIGIVDSDSTFTSYLTDETIFSSNGKIKLKGIKKRSIWINDDIALKFNTTIELMVI